MAFEPVLPVGTTFADYVIDGVLARGGMGVVYRATQQHPRRRVALKLITPERAADPAYRDRFLRETDSLASLEHPNIVPIHAAGEWEGQLYLAMRLVDGSDLGTLIAREGPMAPGRALSLVAPVADALEAAHAEGLVHRDVKPANILVDSRGAVYLTDFGLTKRSVSETGPTLPGQAIGSPGYMSPEQFTTGISADPTIAARSDQYSLACVLYACLTGAEPYHRDTWEAAMWAHVYAPIPHLSERRPDLPAGVDGVLETALAKAPADRFASVTAFVGAFREALPPADRVAPPVVPQAGPQAAPGAASEAAPAVIAAVVQATPPAPPAPPAIPEAPERRRRLSDILATPPAPPAPPSDVPPPDDAETIVSPIPASLRPPAATSPGPPPTGRRLALTDNQLFGIGGAAVALLLVVGLALGGAFNGSQAGSTASPGPTSTTTAERPTPTDTPTEAPTDTPSSPKPIPSAVIATYPPKTGDRSYLLSIIPAAFRDTCFDLDVRESVARVGCRTDGVSLVTYSLFVDSATLDAYYDGWIEYYKIPRDSGVCKTKLGEREWSYTDTATQGRTFCTATLPDSAEAVVGWTHADQLVVAEAFGSKVKDLDELWLTGALMIVP